MRKARGGGRERGENVTCWRPRQPADAPVRAVREVGCLRVWEVGRLKTTLYIKRVNSLQSHLPHSPSHLSWSTLGVLPGEDACLLLLGDACPLVPAGVPPCPSGLPEPLGGVMPMKRCDSKGEREGREEGGGRGEGRRREECEHGNAEGSDGGH